MAHLVLRRKCNKVEQVASLSQLATSHQLKINTSTQLAEGHWRKFIGYIRGNR